MAVASRESSVSDARASPVPSTAPGTTRSNSAVPTRLQDGFEHVNIQSTSSGSPLATSGATSDEESSKPPVPSSPIGAEPTRLKRRVEPIAVTPPSQSSWTSSQSPSVVNSLATKMKPELLQKVYPKLTMDEILETLNSYPYEEAMKVCRRLRALERGEIFKERDTPASTPIKKKDAKLTSAIYANRGEKKYLDKDLSSSLNSPNNSQSAPIARADRPKIKKRRVDSDSGSDWDDDSDDGKRKTDDVPDIDEDKALEIFNTCEVEELTGSIGKSAVQQRTEAFSLMKLYIRSMHRRPS
jgi:hypothetical protein